MRLSFDPVKNERNIRPRGLDFAVAAAVDWDGAVVLRTFARPAENAAFWRLGA
jgi:uncharacterized DUF497 family protein